MKIACYIKPLLILLMLSQTESMVWAQTSKEEKFYSKDDGHWIAEIPLWIPGFRGQLAYGEYNLTSSGKRNEREFEKINSDAGLQFYFVGRIAIHYKNLRIQADAFSGRVGSAFSYTSRIGGTEKEFVYLEIQSTVPRLVLGYSVWNKLTDNDFKIELVPYVGLRYVSFHMQSEVFDSTEVVDLKPAWIEPLAGLYLPLSYHRFKMEWQLDYGYAGKNSSWVISNRYRYRISKLIDVQLGWNLLQLNHHDTLGNVQIETMVRLFGPTAGIGFRF